MSYPFRTAFVLAALASVCLAGCSWSRIKAGRAKVMPAKVAPGGIIATDYSEQIAATLAAAGDNAPQLRRFLDHFAASGDAEKAKAAEFLVANMAPHGFTEAALFDADGQEVRYDSLEYDTFEQAMAALVALKKAHKGLRTKRKRRERDIRTLGADYLIEQTDQAFEAWRAMPWAEGVTFDTFCNYILPYRGSNEPVNRWRGPCRDALAPTLAGVVDVNDVQAISKLCSKQRGQWVKFHRKCYLHPTDQGFDDMRRTGLGRCEDLSNMRSYLNRANGIPMTSDYTPAWARGNNNHAWNVLLDGEGRAYPGSKAMLGAAKVYRKMYAMQPGLPVFHAAEGETIPPWLAGRCYLDVTAEYRPAFDVTVHLARAAGAQSTWAYLCVFNSGRWTPIAAGRIHRDAETAAFGAVGDNIAYLPAYFVDGELVPAGPVMLLEKGGTVRVLDEPVREDGGRIATTMRRMKDVDINPDTGKPIPAIHVEAGKTYELFYWEGEWQSLGEKKAADDSPLAFDNIPAGRMYRLVETGGRDQERPFTIDAGKQVLW